MAVSSATGETGDPRRRNGRVTDGVSGWTVSGYGSSADDDVLLRDATNLLRAELPDPRLADDTAYLRWCYRQNPLGAAWERYHYVASTDATDSVDSADSDDEPLLVAHYLNYPRRYRGPGGELLEGAWSQHAVTRSGHQRERHFTRLSFEIFEEATANGKRIVTGVTNAKSTGPVVKYIGWTLIGPLPVRVIPAVGFGVRSGTRRSSTIQHLEVTREWLKSNEFDDLARRLDKHELGSWATNWAPEVLRWRLQCPFVKYWIHISDELTLISTRSSFAGLRATVILKTFPLTGSESRDPGSTGLPERVDATSAIRAAARFHRSAFAVYAGFNGSVSVRGFRPPRRLQPSPLNLIIRSLDDSLDISTVELDTFEFLDMDAY